jgi:cysteinyl-tRNA synthetase
MKIYNTFSASLEELSPLSAGQISMYLCGPTVYDKGHLGHGRSMVAFDLIRRYFLYKGFNVTFVTNFTDIDDKMIVRAKEEGITVKELADKIIPLYESDFDKLRVLRPTLRPLATAFIDRMVLMVKDLMQKDMAYEIAGDGIYFDVEKFKAYGKLSKQKLDELQHGSRIAVKDQKRGASDFVLWKFKKEGEPSWVDDEGVIAEGRPGWHIECSAMTYDLLGETFDIHAGGQDLVFPHHECEIAQSEAYTGKQFAKYWMHNGFVNIDGEKMSKSLNNFTTLDDTFKSYSPLVVRFLLISTHYRSPIDFNESSLEQSKAALARLQDFYWRIVTEKSAVHLESIESICLEAFQEFEVSMDTDFEISGAIGSVFSFVKKVNSFIDANGLSKANRDFAIQYLEKIDSVLGVLNFDASEFSSEILAIIEKRNKARTEKDYASSDALRDELTALGVQSIDTDRGSFYRGLVS